MITDGAENDSLAHGWRDVAGKLARRRAAGWELIYLGPGAALDDARRMGFTASEVHPWEATEAGAQAAFATVTGTALRRDEPGTVGAFLDGMVRREPADLGEAVRRARAQQRHRNARRRQHPNSN